MYIEIPKIKNGRVVCHDIYPLDNIADWARAKEALIAEGLEEIEIHAGPIGEGTKTDYLFYV